MRNTNTQQARKQRKNRYNADLHVKQKFVHVHLSPELRKKYGFRNVQLRKGDKVKVCRGQYSKKEAKVDRIDLKHETIFLEGLEIIKKDGTKVPFFTLQAGSDKHCVHFPYLASNRQNL